MSDLEKAMESGGWIGVASMFIAALFAWLNKRESIRHGEDLNALKTQNAIQADQIDSLTIDRAQCNEQHAQTIAKLGACEEKHASVELRLTALETARMPRSPTSKVTHVEAVP